MGFAIMARRNQCILRDEKRFLRSKFVKALAREAFSAFGAVEGCILDVGCGRGFWTKMLRSSYTIGVDIKNAFDKRKISPRLDFILADGFRLPFKNECMAGAICFDVIEHVSNDLDFLLELNRVLKKGAILLSAAPNKNRLTLTFKKLVGKPVKYPYHVGEGKWHLREYSKNDLINLLKSVKFEVCSVRGVFLGRFPNYGLCRFPRVLEEWSQGLLVKAKKLSRQGFLDTLDSGGKQLIDMEVLCE